jgi:hypothetical protein
VTVEADELVSASGQRAQQQGVDEREYGTVRANSEREDQDGDEGERRRFPQRSSTESKILKELVYTA